MTESIKQGLSPKDAKRQLATIQIISAIHDIPKADFIKVADILGWKVVVKANEYKVGQPVVFFEIDSFLPVTEPYLFLGEPVKNPIANMPSDEPLRLTGYRIATMKLRNQVSQGLAIALDAYPEDIATKLQNLPIGTDVTELLDIQKYDKPETVGSFGMANGVFPSQFIEQSDELRIQSIPDALQQITGQSYYKALKYDGTSVTIIKHDDEIIIASRSNKMKAGNTMEKVLKANRTWDILMAYPKNFAIQAEFYGPAIQSNRVGVSEKRLAIFNAVDENRQRLPLKNMIQLATDLKLELVDIFEIGAPKAELAEIKAVLKAYNKDRINLKNQKLPYGQAKMPQPTFVEAQFNDGLESLIDQANKLKYNQNGQRAEGMVIRNTVPSTQNTISFKVLNNKYLLKYAE